jgi:hypothetical protein
MGKYSDELFIEAVKNSVSYRQVAIYLKIHSESSGNYNTMKKKVQCLNLDISHFIVGGIQNCINRSQERPLQEFLDSGQSSYTVKHRLYKEGLLKEECAECGCKNIWNNRAIVLQLDHIDGNNKNNKLTNLRILCPNCHSQTDTYASKGLKRSKEYHKLRLEALAKEKICVICNSKFKTRLKNQKHCSKKCAQIAARRTERPTKEILEQEINQYSWVDLGKKYGVTDNAVKKWAQSMEIELPTNRRGYWQKQRANSSQDEKD